MQCPKCKHKVATPDYQVPQTTVYPDINKCYPYGGYRSSLSNFNGCAPSMAFQWVTTNATVMMPNALGPSLCAGIPSLNTFLVY